jgi:hypothetical protein
MATEEKGGRMISKNKSSSSRVGYTDNTESMSSSVGASLIFSDSGLITSNYNRQDIVSQFPGM